MNHNHGLLDLHADAAAVFLAVLRNLHELKRDEILVDGIPFVCLPRLRSWKQKMGRPKDLTDLQLIDRYLG